MATKQWTGASSSAWATSGNWSPSGAPGAGDTVIIGSSATAALTGSDVSATSLASLTITMGMAYTVGSSATPLKCSATTVTIGSSDTTSAPANQWAVHTTNAATISVQGSAQAGVSGVEPVLLLSDSSSATLNVSAGLVGLATIASSTSSIGAVTVGGGQLNCGSGVTFSGTNTMNGGVAYVNSNPSPVVMNSGTLTTQGTYTLGTLTTNGGTLYANHRPSSGNAVTTWNFNGGTVSTRTSSGVFLVGTINFTATGTTGTMLMEQPNQIQASTAFTISSGVNTRVVMYGQLS